MLGEIEDHGAAERAVDARHRHAADGVDEHLVPGEDALRIGAGVAVDGEAEDDVVVIQVEGVFRGQHRRVAKRRDAVLPHAAPDDLVEPDERFAGRVEIGRESRVDEAVERALEGGIARVPRLWRIPHPALPGVEVVAEPGAGFPFHDAHQDARDLQAAGQADRFQSHRQERRLPFRLDQLPGARLVALLPDEQGEESPGDGAVGGLRPGVSGGRRQHQENAERDDEAANGRHGMSHRPAPLRPVRIGC